MKTLYLDIFSGISGDMFLGAMLDLGVDVETLKSELQRLPVDGYHLHTHRQQKSGIQGVKFDVVLNDTHDHSHDHSHEHGRNFSDIRQLIGASSLSAWVQEKAVAVFHRVAVAEGKVHGLPPDQVHFHEVGAVDSIVDIVGACIALELLGKPRVLAASVIEGTGWVMCAHGRFPVPTAATLEILGARGIPLTQCDEPAELVTPTGAALLAEFAETFGPMTQLVAHKIGYGLGTRDCQTRPNVLRAVLGDATDPATGPASNKARDWESDQVTVLECNLDDTSPEILAHVTERLLEAGAKDVLTCPAQMKKGRSGFLFTVLAPNDREADLAELILRNTSAFGVRRHQADRWKLCRESRDVQTPYGTVSVKIGTLNGDVIQTAPEYESCRTLAAQSGVPIKDIYQAATRAAQEI